MRKLIITCAIASILFTGCKKEIKESIDQTKAAKEIVKTGVNIATDTPKTLNYLEKLTQTEPLTQEEIAKWMPEELIGMPRDFYNGSIMSQFGISGASATFQEKNSTYISVQMVDGAGEKGVTAIGPFIMMKNMEVNREGDDGYEKIVEEQGIRASERFFKGGNKYRITFLFQDRLGVTVESENISRELVWKAIQELHFEKLL